MNLIQVNLFILFAIVMLIKNTIFYSFIHKLIFNKNKLYFLAYIIKNILKYHNNGQTKEILAFLSNSSELGRVTSLNVTIFLWDNQYIASTL